MKKNLLIAMMCVLGLFGTLRAQTTITIGEGENFGSNLPYYDYYCWSISQQIYTSDELAETGGVAVINDIAFKSATEKLNNTNITIYMLNTDKASFANEKDWVAVTAGDKVFEGIISTTGLDQWCGVELTTPFVYTGGNLLVCVCTNIKDEETEYEEQDEFYYYSASEEMTSLYTFSYEYKLNPEELSSDIPGTTGVDKNQVQFNVSAKTGINVNFESVNLGNVALGEYWSGKEEVTALVSAASSNATITNVASDNSFFVLSADIDYTANPVKVVVSYDKTASAGEKAANLTITDSEGNTAVVPMTATAYNPVSPDVFELAKEVTFSGNTYTDTPDFTTLNDDYILPNEGFYSNAPDAVYALSIEMETMVLVDVKGTNSKYALYAEDFGGEAGPMTHNTFTGEEKVLSTTFIYDFENGNIDDFTLINYDQYEDYNWLIEGSGNKYLTSYSFKGWYDENNNWVYMNEADERILTNTAYPITPNSVLTLDVDRKDCNTFLALVVEVTQDGENFIEIATIDIDPIWMDQMPDYQYQLSRRINIGERFAALNLEYGNYQVVLHHAANGGGQITVDNFALTERSNVVPVGNYYLVVAAEDAYTVDITLGDIPEEPVTPAVPTNVNAKAASTSAITLTWDAVEKATSYNVCQGTSVIANVTEPTYTVEGLEYNKEYCFTVTALNTNLESDYSDEACAKTLGEGVEEIATAFCIYPNPVENKLFIEAETNIEEISVYNVNGQQTTISSQKTSTTAVVNVENLNSGFYFVKVTTENGEIVKRFVKK